MNKNIKRIFFVLTLVTLLIAVGSVSAVDDANGTTAVENSISDATISDNDYVATEPVTTSNDKQVDTKTIEKEEKNLKTSTKTVEVNNYNELTNVMNNAVKDADNDEYIINLNEGTYQITANVNYRIGSYTPNIIINANGQTLTATATTRSVTYNNGCNITINDAIINHRITVQVNGPITLNNVTVTNVIIIQEGNNKIGHLILNNTTITNKISNYGQLIVNDNNVFAEGFTLSGNGEIICNNSNRFYQYYSSFGGDNTLFNMTIDKDIENYGNLTLNNVTVANKLTNNGNMTLNNVKVENDIVNKGKLVISDDTTFGDNVIISGNGKIEINDTNKIASILESYNGYYTFINSTLTVSKNNYANLTLINSTIDAILNNCANANLTLINCNLNNLLNNEVNATIKLINSTVNNNIVNKGNVYIDENTIFGKNGEITDIGPVYTDNIVRILPNISTISGNYTISDTVLNKSYKFRGNHTLNNCTIYSEDNNNYGILIINNSIINSTSDIFMNNYCIVLISNNTNIINGNITGHVEIFNETLPDDLNTFYHIITNDTISNYFDSETNTLTDIVNSGDILDFRGIISNVPEIKSLIINKPVNIITSTGDGRIERFTNITYTNGASGSNISGLYTYNTQFYVRNANNILFDGISNVVNSSAIGWGVGQTSIGHNSTNITVKNSYFYTKDNGGSSTFVFNWADNSTLVNSTVEADGNVGNLVYLTTYNVNIPSGTTANCNNQIINNTIRGPETATAICWAIVLSGNNNTVDGNTIHYVGTGITGQWGSGITGQGIDDNATSLVNNSNHKIFNNKLYTGVGFTGITGCILVNNTFYNNNRFRIGDDSLAINNTANNIEVMGKNSIIRNNNITNNQTYTITGNGTNNTIKDNYLKSLDKYADESVNLNKERNTIANNTPKIELIIDTTEFTPGQTTTIKAGIYFDGEIITDITKGKVTFKVDGKTLKDTTGKVIYAKIVNGTATIENYTVPDTWKEGSTIQAIYSGSTQCDKLTSEKTEITITKEAPTFTIDPVEPATAGNTITLKATITDNNKVINTGKVVFKINGKTVKDANGKVIYAKVVNNEVIVEYTLPDSYKAKDYIITAVLISPDYERLEDSKTLTVN